MTTYLVERRGDAWVVKRLESAVTIGRYRTEAEADEAIRQMQKRQPGRLGPQIPGPRPYMSGREEDHG